MATLGGASLDELILGQGDAGLNSVLGAFRASSGDALQSGPDLNSSSRNVQLDQTPAWLEAASQGTSTGVFEANSLSSQSISRESSTAGTVSSQAGDVNTEPLTGMVKSAPLVSTQAVDTKINFQPDTAPVPTGYLKDIGEAYSDTRGYGWVRQGSLNKATHVPLDITPNTRDRERRKIDQRLDTLIHMQYPTTIPNSTAVKTPAAWEYALPSGYYSVTVSVGDQPAYDGYNSQHKINVEGVTAIQPFTGHSIQEYELGTVQVNVTDGKLTVDAIGGRNTKINYIEVKSVSPGEHPSILSSLPTSRQEVSLNAGVSLKMATVSGGTGVDAATLTSETIQLYRTNDNTLIPGNINTTAANDAIVYQPSRLLEASTNYTFRLSDGVKDESGNPFVPFSTTFSTGTTSIPKTPEVNFLQTAVYSGASTTSLIISPDNTKLYAASLDGNLRCWTIDSNSGNLTNLEIFDGFAIDRTRPQAIIGMAFDPTNPNVLWVSNNDTLYQTQANDFTGKISKVTLNPDDFSASTYQDYIVGLPRSTRDHLSNSLVFGPDGKLYLTQGSNSSMGAPDIYWDYRPERLLTAAVLQIDPRQTPSQPFNVQTENYTYTDSNGQAITTIGNYNPRDPNAPVKIFATGMRNAYDLVWHSNGSLYVPTNGSQAGGNTPDNPKTPIDEGVTNVAIQKDYLFQVAQGGYYGHPNPKRGEYILNGGNPTGEVDLAEVVAQGSYKGYSVGTLPDPNYQGFAWNFGYNRSPNGVIEYQSDTFNGALKNQLLVVEYSSGDDILALKLDDNGNVSGTGVTQLALGLKNPVDIIEDTRTGNLYVAELVDSAAGQGQITLLTPG